MSIHPNTPHPLVTQRHKSYDTAACEAVLMIGIATLSLKPSCEHGQRSNVLPKVLTGFLRGSVCGGKGMFVWLMGVKHSRGHSRQGHGDNIRAVVLIILIVFNGEIPTPPPRYLIFFLLPRPLSQHLFSNIILFFLWHLYRTLESNRSSSYTFFVYVLPLHTTSTPLVSSCLQCLS